MASPFQPLPPLIVALVVAIAGFEIAFELGAAGQIGGPEAVAWRVEAMRGLGFFEPQFAAMLSERRADPGALVRLVSYPLVHGGRLHAIFAGALLLALGQGVSRSFAPAAVAALLVAAAVGGALAYGAVGPGRAPLIGAYPLVYGLIGAFTQALLVRARRPRARFAAFRLVGVLAGMQLAFRVGFGVGGAEWVAEIGGFAAGFGLAYLVAPEGPARLRRWRDRLRTR